MKQKKIILALSMIILLGLIFTTVANANQSEFAAIRESTAQFHRLEAAKSAGYVQVPGLDHCFDNPGVGAMCYHFIQTSSLDLNLNLKNPEAMVYAPGPNGVLQLAAVEYIVPADAWDSAGNTNPPELLGTSLHLNNDLGVYVLHAWVWKNNPLGILEDWNPEVSCP